MGFRTGTFSFSRGRRNALVAALFLSASMTASAGGEIYGTIKTHDGRALTGPIRWDRNEVFWDDLLNATRREPVQKVEGQREFSFSLFGLKIGGSEEFTNHIFAIPFGHIETLEALDARNARLKLKNGNEILLRSRSTDIGEGMRELIIDHEGTGENNKGQGPVELKWSEIERVDFRPGPGAGRDVERLYGTVVTSDGSVKGTIVFDNDAALAGDLLKGEVKGRDQEYRLGDLTLLVTDGDSDARITLDPSEPSVELTEINNRRGFGSVTVSAVGVGSVEIDWDDVTRIEFLKPPESPRYGAFDGGHRLSGTAHTTAGKSWSGQIVWDRDETYTYDALDGERGALDYAIPFAYIASIHRTTSESSEIVVAGGERLELRGTNDVNDDNRGILVHLEDGSIKRLEWEDLDRVEFVNLQKLSETEDSATKAAVKP